MTLDDEPPSTLKNSEWLAGLPEGSLGRTYHAFMEEERLSAQGLVDLPVEAGLAIPDDGWDRHFIGRQLRDMHDLFHVLCGYGRDESGEICVLAFSYPHQYTRSFALIATLGALVLWAPCRQLGIATSTRYLAVLDLLAACGKRISQPSGPWPTT